MTGCTKVSPGCKNCYAERFMARFPDRQAFTDIVLRRDRLLQPLRWRKPRRVFVNSMSDLFHETVPRWFLWEAFRIMGETPAHTYQILTKRPARMYREVTDMASRYPKMVPAPNVWLGVSVEDQKRADERIPYLLKTPAAIRFVSAEPLLESNDLNKYLGVPIEDPGEPLGCFFQPRIPWVIIGGESGPGARACDPGWISFLIRQCRVRRVACFVKQLGSEWAWRQRLIEVGGKTKMRGRSTVDYKGGKPEEWPEDLRVREYPV